MRVYQKHAGDDAKLVIKFHWPNAKIVCFGEEAMELCMREKAVFFLPVNILTVWSPAFLAARHTTVCLHSMYVLLEVLKKCALY